MENNKELEKNIKELGCREKNCQYFDEEGTWGFCTVVFTDKCCLNKKDSPVG